MKNTFTSRSVVAWTLLYEHEVHRIRASVVCARVASLVVTIAGSEGCGLVGYSAVKTPDTIADD